MGQGLSICDRCPDEKGCWNCDKLRQWIADHVGERECVECRNCHFGEHTISETASQARVQIRCTKQGSPYHGICHEPDFRCPHGLKELLLVYDVRCQFAAVQQFLLQMAERCSFNAAVIEGQLKRLKEDTAHRASTYMNALQNMSDMIAREKEKAQKAADLHLWDQPPMGGFHDD